MTWGWGMYNNLGNINNKKCQPQKNFHTKIKFLELNRKNIF